MKVKIANDKATRLINCGELIVVTAAHKDKATATTCAWHLPLSRKPPLVGVALSKKHFSSELIKESKEFIINIPDWSLLDKVIMWGSFSGRERNKFKEANIEPQRANILRNAPRINECVGSIECSLHKVNEIGDHYLFCGEIVYAEAVQDCFLNDFWDTAKVDLIFHLGSKFFFKSSQFLEFNK